ncbi:MAG TPA: hypothetical protein PK808_12450, partial [Polymorphobacter sp.]|nr:hypothetical protein [Polymorphobacter sp.]
MGNCTPSITISAAVRRLHPGLGNALVGAGLVLQANAETELVTADCRDAGRHNTIIVGLGEDPALATATA